MFISVSNPCECHWPSHHISSLTSPPFTFRFPSSRGKPSLSLCDLIFFMWCLCCWPCMLLNFRSSHILLYFHFCYKPSSKGFFQISVFSFGSHKSTTLPLPLSASHTSTGVNGISICWMCLRFLFRDRVAIFALHFVDCSCSFGGLMHSHFVNSITKHKNKLDQDSEVPIYQNSSVNIWHPLWSTFDICFVDCFHWFWTCFCLLLSFYVKRGFVYFFSFFS